MICSICICIIWPPHSSPPRFTWNYCNSSSPHILYYYSSKNPPMPYAPPTRQGLAPDYTKASDNANVDLFSNFLVRRSTMTRHHWTPKMCQHLHVLSTSLTFLNLLTGWVGDKSADVNTEFSSLVLDVNGYTDDSVSVSVSVSGSVNTFCHRGWAA